VSAALKTPLPPYTPQEARKDHRRMLRFMALNATFGVALGLVVFAALVWLDTGGIGTRIFASDNPWQPVVLIAVPLCLTFGAGAAASAIMLLPYARKYSDMEN
jgi:hypothetical protein